jgi:hypothetical protein
MHARITTPRLEWLAATTGGPARRRKWRLTEPLWFGLEGDTGPHWLIIPTGFETDLASIPWPASTLLRPSDVNPAAPVVHDWLYRNSGNVPVYLLDPVTGLPALAPHEGFTREQADGIFRTILIETGTPRWKVVIMYRAVRVGGGRGFKQGL